MKRYMICVSYNHHLDETYPPSHKLQEIFLVEHIENERTKNTASLQLGVETGLGQKKLDQQIDRRETSTARKILDSKVADSRK